VHDAQDVDAQREQAADVVLTRFEGRTTVLANTLKLDPQRTPPIEPSASAITAVLRVPVAGTTAQRIWPTSGVEDAGAIIAGARTAMEVARDTGDLRASPPLDGKVVVAVAEYVGDTTPSSTTLRRKTATGWRLAVVDPTRLMQGVAFPAGTPGKVTVGGSSSRSSVSRSVLVAGQPWELSLDVPRADPISFGAVVVGVLTLLGVAILLVTGSRSRRALLRGAAATEALERETRTVAELGPLLQSSLDLAEVLPAVAIRLSDEFGLSRFAVQLHGEHGRPVDVFALGGRAGAASDELVLSAATPELPAGRPAALPLLRAGRTIGRLSVTARRPLEQAQIAALSAAADLIAVATYNVELYEREQASVRRLRDLDQLKDAFLGTISHELRTPITAIGGFVRLLRDRWGQISEEQRLEFLDRVHRNSISLGLLVDDLLDFARLERQALNAPAAPMQLDQHVAATVAQLAPVLGERTIVTDLMPVRALANPGALERVLANLLTNAVKFSPADSPIVVRVHAGPTTATLEVVDQGPGIAAEDRDHVFTRFYRGDSDAARGTRGAGIGLSVVRELVTQMGGTVAARPNEPHGTRMVVTLALDSAASSVLQLPTQERRDNPVPPAIERSGT
jgi:signal transduction histidine kinase